MKYFAVPERTFWSRRFLCNNSVPARILDETTDGSIVPLFCDDILAEYEDVLHRKKFPFTAREVRALIETIRSRGVHIEPGPVDAVLPDLGDVVFMLLSWRSGRVKMRTS